MSVEQDLTRARRKPIAEDKMQAQGRPTVLVIRNPSAKPDTED